MFKIRDLMSMIHKLKTQTQETKSFAREISQQNLPQQFSKLVHSKTITRAKTKTNKKVPNYKRLGS